MKKEINAKNCLYPMPTVLVGALVNGKPNYAAIAHVGIADFGSITISVNKKHYTNLGIRETKCFSVNIPTEDMVKVTDYCGLVSGRDEDKSTLFKTFYGKLKTAPMIEECPVCMECELVSIIDFPNHDLFVGKIIETYCDEKVMTGANLDFSKLRPILFSMTDRSYYRLGERLAKPWSIGKEFKRGTSN
ncbi:MAG: flavin reductase family protein [Methanomassiliicoccales archaeon]